MKRLLASFVLLFVFNAVAQQSAQPKAQTVTADAPSRQDILKLFHVMRLNDQMESMQKTMLQQMLPAIEQTIEDEIPNATNADRERMRALMKSSMDEAMNMYPVHEMIEDFIPVYQKNYTKADVQAITAFYASPAGQRLLDKQPQIMQDAMATIMPKTQARMKKLMERIGQQAQQIAKPAPKKAPPASLQSPQQ